MQMKKIFAIKRGTLTMSDGTIVHLDPDNSKEGGRYKAPMVPEKEVKRFVDAGLIEKGKEKDPSKKDLEAGDENALQSGSGAETEAKRVKEATKDIEGEGAAAATTAVIRNHPAPIEEGIEAGDPDAPPAPEAKPAAKPAGKPAK